MAFLDAVPLVRSCAVLVENCGNGKNARQKAGSHRGVPAPTCSPRMRARGRLRRGAQGQVPMPHRHGADTPKAAERSATTFCTSSTASAERAQA